MVDQMGPAITRVAPAKINLFLHVTGRRSDGYHLLESLFAFTRSGDEITVMPAKSLSLEIEGPFFKSLAASGGEAKDNLVMRAAHALREASSYDGGAHIVLRKALPIAAGIGGGSSDAAATLLALNDLWQLDLSARRLEEIALDLGADVPACLYQHPLRVTGVGEKLDKTRLPAEVAILLVNPMTQVSTPEVFRHLNAGAEGCSLPLRNWGAQTDAEFWDWLANNTRNDLQGPASDLCPEVRDVIKALHQQPGVGLVRMSGSGATCFALFRDQDSAAVAAHNINASNPNWWCSRDSLIPS